MEEAVEICKLRLFLKLVAQLKTYDQIEPLPDIDFNVRAGNTLVGFTTLQEIRDSFAGTPGGQSRMLYAEEEEELRRIEEDAHIADRQFQLFHEMQTKYGMDAADFADAKLKLRQRLDSLRAELDRYLAKEYAIGESDEEAYAQWRTSHQPFHWFVEFFGIMHNGGFDVIVGNPPYVEYTSVKRTYSVLHSEMTTGRNLHSMVTDRCLSLSHRNSFLSLIVPIALPSTDRMMAIRKSLTSNAEIWVSNYAIRPSKLFSGAEQRLSLFVASRRSKGKTFTTRYMKWNSKERDFLFQCLQYHLGPWRALTRDVWPKFESATAEEIFHKMASTTTAHC